MQLIHRLWFNLNGVDTLKNMGRCSHALFSVLIIGVDTIRNKGRYSDNNVERGKEGTYYLRYIVDTAVLV